MISPLHAYESWGFKNLDNATIDVLNEWAPYLYGPLLEDRRAAIQETDAPQLGREVAEARAAELREARRRHAAAGIRLHGPRRDRPGLRVPASGPR